MKTFQLKTFLDHENQQVFVDLDETIALLKQLKVTANKDDANGLILAYSALQVLRDKCDLTKHSRKKTFNIE